MNSQINAINENIETRGIDNMGIIDAFKKRLTRDLKYDRPDGDDGKLIGTPTTIGSKSKKNTNPSRQRYQGD